MDPRLLDYYNIELAHLRDSGAEFAREFPKVASRLGIEGLEVADPYVERLMEGFAFVAARTQMKIDAEFPRFTQHLLEIVYPHYLRPLPSCLIVALQPNLGETSLADGSIVPAGSRIRSTVPRGEQTACEFRTAHPVTLWPIEISAASYFSFAPDLPLAQALPGVVVRGGLRIRLKCHAGLKFNQLKCDQLDFFVNGSNELAGPLYELIHGHRLGALILPIGGGIQGMTRLPAQAVRELGFEPSQSLLPGDHRSFDGYRLLHEYFAFPQRFQFFSVAGLRAALGRIDASECELVLAFDRDEAHLEPLVDARSLSLFATPIVNLQRRRADRIQVDDSRFEHHLVVDRARPMDFEVFAVQSMRGLGDTAEDEVEFRPFYGQWTRGEAGASGAYYTVRREPRKLSGRQQRDGTRSGYVGGEVFVSLVDERAAPYALGLKQLAAEVLVTNRDLPLLLPISGRGVLMLEESAPVIGVQILVGPSRPRAGFADGDFAWRLLSHLSLNYLSVLDAGQETGQAGGPTGPQSSGQNSGQNSGKPAAALRELLSLYADIADPAARKAIQAVRGLSAKPVIRMLPNPGPITFGRGLGIDLAINEDAFGGAGGYLFGSVLEKFFAHHVSINVFTQTTMRSESRGEIARWGARVGSRMLG